MIVRCLGIALALALSVQAYVRYVSNAGIKLFRHDSTNIQFLINTSIVAGATNAQGQTMITADSNPAAALNAATSVWAAVTTAAVGFLPLSSTTLQNDPADGHHVMTIQDTPENRSIVGSFLAITLYRYSGDGGITDTDIIYNPKIIDPNGNQAPLSTTHQTGTYDLRSLTTHELGHSLGANHSGLIGATMYQAILPFASYDTVAEATLSSTLSVDDAAFLTEVYPAAASTLFGKLSGTVRFQSGSPILGGMVVAIDPSTGIAVNGITSLTDGTFTIFNIPPGNYQVYAQPLNGPVMPVNLNLTASQVTPSFRTTFAGGNAAPSTIAITVGGTANADITVDPAAAALQILHLGTGSAGGTNWSFADVKSLTAGQAADILLWGQGLDSTITAAQLRVLGPGIAVRPATLHMDTGAVAGGLTPLRFTVDVAPYASRASTAVGVVSGTDAAMRSAGLVVFPNITGPAFTAGSIVNAASFKVGPVAPGEIFTIFGTQFGPSQITGLALNAAGRVSTLTGATRAYFDDVPAPMIYSAAGQLSGVVPYSVAGNSTASVRIEYNGVSSAAVPVPIATASPAVFTLSQNGSGPGAILNQNASLNTASNAAAIGSIIQIFATGEGQTNPPGVDGLIAASAFPAPLQTVSVKIGGADADVVYAGTAPQSIAGFLQVNARVPAGIATGPSVPVTISVGTAVSPTVTVAVR